jgi:co-chaperonin GroES (HSP10)
MNVKPLNKRVYIAEIARETTSGGGLILTGKGLGDMATARVLGVGPDVKEVSEGDEVYVNWSKASSIKVEGKERAMISEDDIIAVVEKE